MFLTEEDYIVASNTALNVLQQCSEENGKPPNGWLSRKCPAI